MKERHRLLARQAARHLGDKTETDESLSAFLDAVDEAYRQYDDERTLLERSLDLSSSELQEANEALELRVQKRTVELEHALKVAEQASSSKSRFLAHMSHEIRTPLNGVLGMLQLLSESPVNDDQLRQIGAARASGKALLHVINDVLDFSKIEAGELSIENRPCELRQVFRDVVALFEALCREKDIAIHLTLGDEVPHAAVVDEVRLRQVISNLVSNAAKFTPAGEIVVEASSVRGDPNDDNVMLEVAVRDSGIGIPHEALATIFDAFVQIEDSHARQVGGTGLGLPISRQLVRAMGGEMSVASTFGEGSEFSFTLPLRVIAGDGSDHSPAPEGSAAPETVSGLRVLIVEDSPINQEIAKAMLTGAGAAVTIAESGERALAVLETAEFDVILMDVQMPGMDGLETTRRLRAHQSGAPGPQPAVVGLTANATPDDRRACLGAGMDDFVTKPYSKSQLLSAVGRWGAADGEPAESAAVDLQTPAR